MSVPKKLTGSPIPLDGRCAAKLRRSNPPRYCQAFPAQGRKRCKLHGGMSPRGVDSPHWRGRGYSKDLPVRLADRWRLAQEDPELTSVRSELALMDARMGELAAQLTTGESNDAWRAVRSTAARIKDALANGKRDELPDLLERLEKAVSDADSDRKVWREIRDVVEQRRLLADTERKREESLKVNLNHREAQAFLAMIMAAVMDECDAETTKRISARLRSLLNKGKTAHLQPPMLGEMAQDDVRDADYEIISEDAE